MARRSGASADRARRGQSLLAAVLRHRPGEDAGGFRLAGRTALATRSCSTGWRREFVRTGWDVKAMQRLIVTSATYRQSSAVTPQTARKGPGESAARARSALPPARRDGPRQRARRQRPARIRPSAAPACIPYQPPGLWEEMAFGDELLRAGLRRRATAPDLYRRSMYTFWKRTVPPPRSPPSTRPTARSAPRGGR